MVKRGFFALLIAAGISAALYWITLDRWILLGAFLISLHVNFMVLVVTLPRPNPLDKLFEAYWYGVYSLIFGGLGVLIWIVLTAVLVIISPLFYVFAGRKYEIGYGDKSHKARKVKSAVGVSIDTLSNADDIISTIDRIYRSGGATKDEMRSIAAKLRIELGKPENGAPARQRELNDAMTKLLSAMSRATK